MTFYFYFLTMKQVNRSVQITVKEDIKWFY